MSAVIVSGSGNTAASLLSIGGDSGCNVVDEDTDSSMSDVLDDGGEPAPRDELDVEVMRFRDRIFCVIRVCEKGRAGAANGFEKSSTVCFIAAVISSRDVYGKQILSAQL